ncbi:MAG TPA: sulfotransferase [Mycobacteriales bacterium]|nr:sulfotransferase [Mycobacteriales bacterium]
MSPDGKGGAGGRFKKAVNHALERTTGHQITRVRVEPTRRHRVNRLVTRPTFIIAPVRSGSTLLRVILDSHSEICAPHELHLRTMHVRVTEYGQRAVEQIGLDERALEHLLWDRVLHRELAASGKKIIVEKTPNTVFGWDRLQEAWPRARFIFLLRHPASIADALGRVRDGAANKTFDESEVVERIREYTEQVEQARSNLPGLTVKYEELVKEPERVVSGICRFLEVEWEPAMLDYGAFRHGPYVPRLGDWGPKIRSGHIDSDIVVPADDQVPEALRPISAAWDYLS